MIFNKKDFEKLIIQLKPEGFSYKENFGSARFIKKEKDRMLTIAIGYNQYFPHSAVIKGISVDIYFPEVEDLIHPLLDKFDIQNRYGNTTIQKSLINIEGIDYSKLETEINNQSTFDVVSNEVNKIISFGAIPFFKKYQTLKMVNEDLCKMNEEEISDFLSGIVGIKMPLIKKLTNSSGFKSELFERNIFYSDEALKYPQYFKGHEKVFRELFATDLEIS
jgi:hypothetical protein